MFYSGDIDIKPKGSIDVWKAMVDKQVLCNVPLTFVLCCGFASPVLQYLNYNNDLGSVMFNLANKSSTGKTTAEMLAVSAFSNPLMSSGTLISFNGTEQSISDFISNCRGFTIAIDEYGMCAIKNPFQFFYTVCSGKSKKRLNSLCEQREVKDYSSVILSSAEHKLTEGAQEGVLVRIFELNDSLTSSAEQSDEIKRTVIENYAVAAEPFISFLLTKLETLQTDYMNEIQKLLEMSDGSNPLKKRIFSKLAIITLSADYVKSALNLSLDVDKLRKYAVKIEKEISTDELPEQHLLEIIQEDVSTHYSKYAFDKSNISDKGYGLVLRENGYVEYYITKPVFKRIIAENNISNYNTILDKLKKDGILICEDDRKTIRKRIISGMNSQVCYGFRLKDDIQETDANTKDNNNCDNPYRRTISSKRNSENVISEDEVCDIDDIDLELTSES